MGQVNITLNGRTFQLWCGDGQEDYVQQLSLHIARHIDELKKSFGAIPDEELFLMAGLMVADELRDTQENCGSVEAEPQRTGRSMAGGIGSHAIATVSPRPVYPEPPAHAHGYPPHGHPRQIPQPAEQARRQAVSAPVSSSAAGMPDTIDDSRLRHALQQISVQLAGNTTTAELPAPSLSGLDDGEPIETVFSQAQSSSNRKSS